MERYVIDYGGDIIAGSKFADSWIEAMKVVNTICSGNSEAWVRDRKNPSLFDIVTHFKGGAIVSQRIAYPTDTRKYTPEQLEVVHKAFGLSDNGKVQRISPEYAPEG